MATRHLYGHEQYERKGRHIAVANAKIQKNEAKYGHRYGYHIVNDKKEVAGPVLNRESIDETENSINEKVKLEQDTLLRDGVMTYGYKKIDKAVGKQKLRLESSKYVSGRNLGFRSDAGHFGAGYNRVNWLKNGITPPEKEKGAEVVNEDEVVKEMEDQDIGGLDENVAESDELAYKIKNDKYSINHNLKDKIIF